MRVVNHFAAIRAVCSVIRVLCRNFLVFAILFLLPRYVQGINIVVDSWGNLNASQQTVTQAVLDDWEALLPNVNHDVHLTFNYVVFSSMSIMALKMPDAEWVITTKTNLTTKSVEEVAIGVSFNFTEDGDFRPISCDIEMNSSISWYVGLDAPPAGQYDWYSVMSHEVCHAIGFTVYYTRFSRNVTSGPDTLRTYNSGGTPTATLVNASSGTHLSPTYHPDFLMVPSIGSGVRREPSVLENDVLWHDVWDYPDPDLTYGNQTLSVVGTTVDISLRARNISTTTGCDSPSYVGYYLSVNDYISTSDYRIGTDYVLALPANSYSTESISIDVRSINPPIPVGTYYVGFLVDYLNDVQESDESNNRYAFPSPLVTISQMSAPTGVSASDGIYSDHIHISWNTVSGATHYKLYRATTSSSGDAVAITGWQTATSFDDYLDAGERYYYWVKAAASVYGSGESNFSSYNSGYVLPIALVSDVIHTVSIDPTFYYTDMTANDTLWWVVGVRYEVPGENWSLRLYADPSCSSELVSSAYEEKVDFVVVDGHHVANSDRGVKCYRFRGSGNATVEFEGYNETLAVGNNAAIAWPAGDVVEMWTISLTPGTYRFDLTFNSGTNDLGFALYSSGDGDYYRTRHEYAGRSDNAGGGVNESFIYTVSASDNYGLCVWANGTTAANIDLDITALSAGLWEGDVSSNWHTAGNWNDVQVPDSSDDVVIPTGTPYSPVISSAVAYCNDLTIESGATLTVGDQTIDIGNTLTCYGYFNMNNTGSRAYVDNDVRWEDGSTCTMIGSARMYVSGDWEFKAGANVVLNSGYIEFTGSSISWIRSYESACKLYNVLSVKVEPAYLGVSAQCVDELHMHNLYVWTSFHSYSYYPVVIEGFMNSPYDTAHFQWHRGSLVLNGTNAIDFKPNTGDYLEDLVIDTTGVINCSTNYYDTLTINGDVIIKGGGLCPNNVTLDVGGSWSNGVGTAGFEEGTDTVRFVGDEKSVILTDESFYYVYVNKTYAAFDGVEITSGKTVTVQNDLYINDGTVEMNVNSVLDINDDLIINSGAGLNANDGVVTIFLADEWYNYNTNFTTIVGFNPGYYSTFIFDGSNNQYMYASEPAVAEVFANLIVNKSAGNLMLDEPLHVLGDCTIQSGGWSSFAASTGMTHIFEGDLIVRADGSWLDDSSGSTIRFEGSSTATLIYDGVSGAFNEVEIAKGVGSVLNLGSDVPVNGSLFYVDSGIVELDENTLTCAGGVTVDAGGELRVNLGGTLSVGGGYLLSVNGGGILTANDGRYSKARITRNGTGYYSFQVNGGSTIGAENCIFEYMDVNGVHVYDTGLINPAMPFNGCTFQNGPTSGPFLWVDNNETHTIVNAVFPTSRSTGYNVAKIANQGSLKFVHATGTFAGESYDYDPNNRIDWVSGAITSINITGPAYGTVGGLYNFYVAVSGDSVLTPINYYYQVTDLSPLSHTHSSLLDMLDVTWNSPGSKLIRVTASNDAGSLVQTHNIELAELAVQSVSISPSACNITLCGTCDESTYYLEYCTNLLDHIWIPLAEVAGSNGTTLICPAYGGGGIPSNAPAMFFRGMLKPAGGL